MINDINSYLQVIATGIAVLIVERLGRKILLILSASLMCVSILALGVFFYMKENMITLVNPDGKFEEDLITSLGWLPLVSLIIYILAFSIGMGPLPWMMNGEFFSLEAKGLAASLATAMNWLCAFCVSKFEVNIENAINPSGAYFLYAAINATGALFVLFIVPETRGKTPDDMKKHFS